MSDEQSERKIRDEIRNLTRRNNQFAEHMKKIASDFMEIERLRDTRYEALKQAVRAVCEENMSTWYGAQPTIIALRKALAEVDRLEPTL